MFQTYKYYKFTNFRNFKVKLYNFSEITNFLKLDTNTLDLQIF